MAFKPNGLQLLLLVAGGSEKVAHEPYLLMIIVTNRFSRGTAGTQGWVGLESSYWLCSGSSVRDFTVWCLQMHGFHESPFIMVNNR